MKWRREKKKDDSFDVCTGDCINCLDHTCSFKWEAEQDLKYGQPVKNSTTPLRVGIGGKSVAVAKLCKPHQEWVALGPYKVFLKSSGGKLPDDLEVFVDLTGWGDGGPKMPDDLKKYLDKAAELCKMVIWEIKDGSPGPKALAAFVLNMLKDGLKVGFGCIGGHGRTGWLAAKLYKEVMQCSGDEAVKWIRDTYCDKTVETKDQLDNLGCTKATKPSKSFSVVTYWKDGKFTGGGF